MKKTEERQNMEELGSEEDLVRANNSLVKSVGGYLSEKINQNI